MNGSELSSTRWASFWWLFHRAMGLQSEHGLACHLRNLSIVILLRNPPNFEGSRAEVIEELRRGMLSEGVSLAVGSLLPAFREIDLLRDVCSHHRSLLTPIAVTLSIPVAYLDRPEFIDVAWFASSFFHYSSGRVSTLLVALDEASLLLGLGSNH